MTYSRKKDKKEFVRSSKSKWVCGNGCKITKTPCPHLEELLPKADYKPEFESKFKYSGNRVDRAGGHIAERADEKARFISRIRMYLDPIEVDILVLRYVYDEDYLTIAKELGVVSEDTVIRIHNESLAKLKGRLPV